MTLFTLLTGNVVDKNNQPITNFMIRGYHKETKTWSGDHIVNNNSQYNFNLGDGDWLTPSGVINIGDTIVLTAETLDDNILDRLYCVVTFRLTDATSYIINLQLLKHDMLSITNQWYLADIENKPLASYNDTVNPSWVVYTSLIGNTVIAKEMFSDTFMWTYAGIKHYHISKIADVDVFTDRNGIVSKQYKWGSDTISTAANHVFSFTSNEEANGYYPVKAIVTNKVGKIVENTLYLKTINRAPILTYTYTPITPTVKDIFKIHANVIDDNTSLIKVTHSFDNVIIAINRKLSFEWEQSLGLRYQKEHLITAEVHWSDGFTEHVYTINETVTMSDIPPTLNLVLKETDIKDTIRVECVNLTDADGDTSTVQLGWEFFFKIPLRDSYASILQVPKNTLLYAEATLVTSGDYKCICYAEDEGGAVNTAYIEFKIEDNTVKDITGTLNSVEWE